MAPIISTFGSGSARGFGRAQFVLKELFAFTTATFTPGGSTGRFGPSLSEARAGISSPGDDSWKNDTSFFNVLGGIMEWTVPANGSYRITAAGAQGGFYQNSVYGRTGGNGALMVGDFSLIKGEKIKILVGQKGEDASEENGGSGGGGGSFVADINDNPLIVAAGGGGGSRDRAYYTAPSGTPGLSTTSEFTGRAGLRTGEYGNANGAGFLENGAQAVSFVNGGTGGVSNSHSVGGFGGGGGDSIHLGGGGGGYLGGDGGFFESSTNLGDPATGGESFNNGSNQNNQTGGNSGNGFVIIERL